MDPLARRLEELAGRADREVDVNALVERLGDRLTLAVDQVRGDVATAVQDVAEVQSRSAVLEDALDSVSERLEALARDGAAATTRQLAELREEVGTELDEVTERLFVGFEGLRAEVAALPALLPGLVRDAVQDAVRVAVADLAREAIQEVLPRVVRAEVDRVLGQLPVAVTAVLAETRAATTAATGAVSDEVTGALREVRSALGAAVTELAQARTGLEAGTARLGRAGESLVGSLDRAGARRLTEEVDALLQPPAPAPATRTRKARPAARTGARTGAASRAAAAKAPRRTAAQAPATPPGAAAGPEGPPA